MFEDLFGIKKRKPVDGNFKKNDNKTEEPEKTPKEEWPTAASERKRRREQGDTTLPQAVYE